MIQQDADFITADFRKSAVIKFASCCITSVFYLTLVFLIHAELRCTVNHTSDFEKQPCYVCVDRSVSALDILSRYVSRGMWALLPHQVG